MAITKATKSWSWLKKHPVILVILAVMLGMLLTPSKTVVIQGPPIEQSSTSQATSTPPPPTPAPDKVSIGGAKRLPKGWEKAWNSANVAYFKKIKSIYGIPVKYKDANTATAVKPTIDNFGETKSYKVTKVRFDVRMPDVNKDELLPIVKDLRKKLGEPSRIWGNYSHFEWKYSKSAGRPYYTELYHGSGGNSNRAGMIVIVATNKSSSY